MPSSILEFVTGQRVVSGLLVILVVIVLVFGGVLIFFAWGDFKQLKSVYELVVINTLAKPFMAIIAAYVAYVFGESTVRLILSRGQNSSDSSGQK